MAALDTERTHRLGVRAFFLFLGWGIFAGIALLLAVAALWWYGAVYVPKEYVIYFVYGLQVSALCIGAFLLFRFAVAFFAYYAHAYRFDDEYFLIIRGYLDRHETGVVYHQIQTVTVQRPVSARLFGVAHLNIVTSGGSPEVRAVQLPSIAMRKARLIQKELLARAKHGQAELFAPPRYQQVPFEDDEEGDEE